jgi:hypothetical protein
MPFGRLNRNNSLPRCQSGLTVQEYITAASGGNVSTYGDNVIHTFTSSNTFTVSGSNLFVSKSSYNSPDNYRKIGLTINNASIEYLVVAGGGGGGGISTEIGSNIGGGGGGGGYLSSIPGESSGGGNSSLQPLSLASLSPLTILVGGGGAVDSNGSDSAIIQSSNDLVRSFGGGTSQSNGGCGGGGNGYNNTSLNTVPPNSPGIGSQGYDGGLVSFEGFSIPSACKYAPSLPQCVVSNLYSAGGGGAGSQGGSGTITLGGIGGDGILSSATGISTYYAGGGEGGISTTGISTYYAGGGGEIVNSGGGGDHNQSGASGIVVLRYTSV